MRRELRTWLVFYLPPPVFNKGVDESSVWSSVCRLFLLAQDRTGMFKTKSVVATLLALVLAAASAHAQKVGCSNCLAQMSGPAHATNPATNASLTIWITSSANGTCAYDLGCSQSDPCTFYYTTALNVGTNGGSIVHLLEVHTSPFLPPRKASAVQNPVAAGGPTPGEVSGVHTSNCGDFFFYTITVNSNASPGIPASSISGTIWGTCSDCLPVILEE
jgi:hypothetical protein